MIPSLVSHNASGCWQVGRAAGVLLVAALGLALALSAGLDIGLQEGLGAALAHKDTEVPGYCNAKWQMDELQLRHHCCNKD